ncbi:hypothetical protein [Stenotrophomonas sp.]|uniref:hypothetical protein n=1 Tax=Stenotrophomonas sp. TaxID=69392 RepID=UPI0019BEA20B|nr:hypothetical protein [Stenotrophomonas sp.]MBD3826156.1 hypothetical protein [Stenotrophomonas sp.]
MNTQPFPRAPRRMEQPAKDLPREQLSIAAHRIIGLAALKPLRGLRTRLRLDPLCSGSPNT